MALVDNGSIEVADAVPRGRNVRYRGEDVPAGSVVLPAGSRVGPHTLTAVAAAGVVHLPVFRRPKVHILATGDELVPPGQPLGPGQIHETNSLTLRALAARAGAEVIDLGTAPDDRDEIEARVRRGLTEGDVLLVAGGVSVGDHDHVKGALDRAGVEELFWRVKLKPGKPLFCGRTGDGTWAFGLPGNPLSGVCTFLVFVEPLLRRLAGETDAVEARTVVRTTQEIAPEDGRTTYLTATLAPGEADGIPRCDADGAAGLGDDARARPGRRLHRRPSHARRRCRRAASSTRCCCRRGRRPDRPRRLLDRARHRRLRRVRSGCSRWRPGLSVAQTCVLSLACFTGASQFSFVSVHRRRRLGPRRARVRPSSSPRATASTRSACGRSCGARRPTRTS